ncbi:MAG: hypothetical protein QN165_10575, partial [Armatimonadota bacterium]|nr:hypothetical protein [Armatimonadota bacterium]
MRSRTYRPHPGSQSARGEGVWRPGPGTLARGYRDPGSASPRELQVGACGGVLGKVLWGVGRTVAGG